MRKSIWKHAIECGSVDAALAQTDRGARMIMQPIPRMSAIRPATYSLSVAEAKALASQLSGFVETAEIEKSSKV